MRLAFTVRGLPAAQGSARAFVAGGRAVLATGAGKGQLADWRHAIATEARAAMGSRPTLSGPVSVRAEFSFARPKSHYRSSGAVKDSAPARKASKPDADKLARALLDALTGVVFADDALVVDLRAGKYYGDPGVLVVVEELEP